MKNRVVHDTGTGTQDRVRAQPGRDDPGFGHADVVAFRQQIEVVVQGFLHGLLDRDLVEGGTLRTE